MAELTEDGGLSTCCNRNSTICESFAVSPYLTMSDPHLMLWIPVILCLLERSISLITFCSFDLPCCRGFAGEDSVVAVQTLIELLGPVAQNPTQSWLRPSRMG